MTKDTRLNFRADPPTVAALESLRRVYGLSISEACRRALLSVARERGLAGGAEREPAEVEHVRTQ